MASQELAIAKVSLSAALLRRDPTSCTTAEIEHFHSLVNAAISHCSPANVQKCKQWALQHLARSAPRLLAWGKYLIALVKTISSDDGKRTGASGAQRAPSAKRRRLHLLFILNDIFYHSKIRDHNETPTMQLENAVSTVLELAAAFANSPKHSRKVAGLIDIWEENGYFAPAFLTKLRKIVEEAPAKAVNGSYNDNDEPSDANATKRVRDAPFVLPAMHGDPMTPWYDLPAGNWLPVIEPNSTRSMNPAMVKPLQMTPGAPSKSLVDSVKKLLSDVDRMYGREPLSDGHVTLDVDQMGERIELDEISGDVLDGDTYYGWSRAFCEKMKAHRKKGSASAMDDGRGRSYTQSISRSRSPSRRRRSYSRSSSPPASKRRRFSRSPSRDLSRSRQRRGSFSRESSDRRSYSPHNGASHSSRPQYDNHPQPHNPSYGQQPPFPLPPLPSHMMPQHQNFNNFQPIPPPPPPPNYNGPWPPPPPPPLPHMTMGMQQHPSQWPPPPPMPWTGGFPHPPPPGPRDLQQGEPIQQSGFNQYGRGRGGQQYSGN